MTKTRTLLIALMIVPLLLAGGGYATVTSAQGTYCATEAEADMLRRFNELRQQNGLSPLQLSRPLGVAADVKASDMAERDYFAHESPDGRSSQGLLTDVGYAYNTATGEIIASGYSSAGATFEQWLNSPSHLRIMLGDQYTAVGIGSAYNPDARYDWYWAAEFGGVVGEPAGVCGGTSQGPSSTDALIAAIIRIIQEILAG